VHPHRQSMSQFLGYVLLGGGDLEVEVAYSGSFSSFYTVYWSWRLKRVVNFFDKKSAAMADKILATPMIDPSVFHLQTFNI